MRLSLSDVPDIGSGTVRVQIRRTQSEVVVKTASKEVAFATKPALARRMIARAIAAGVSFAWVLGDEVYGSDRRLRIDLEQQERPFVLAIRSNEKLWSTLDDGFGQHAAAALAAAVPEAAWQSLSAGAGAK